MFFAISAEEENVCDVLFASLFASQQVKPLLEKGANSFQKGTKHFRVVSPDSLSVSHRDVDTQS